MPAISNKSRNNNSRATELCNYIISDTEHVESPGSLCCCFSQRVKNEASLKTLDNKFGVAEARKPENKHKNRYRDVSPCELIIFFFHSKHGNTQCITHCLFYFIEILLVFTQHWNVCSVCINVWNGWRNVFDFDQ